MTILPSLSQNLNKEIFMGENCWNDNSHFIYVYVFDCFALIKVSIIVCMHHEYFGCSILLRRQNIFT